MKSKASRLRLKSADSLRFTREEIREFALQVRDRTQSFFLAGRQDLLAGQERLTDLGAAEPVGDVLRLHERRRAADPAREVADPSEKRAAYNAAP